MLMYQQQPISYYLATALVGLSLTACGGGGTETAPTTANTQTSATTTAVSTGWTHCAAEDAYCSVPASSQVRFGYAGKYFTKSVTNGVLCANSVFGDPNPGTDKSCDYQIISTPPPLPPPTTPTASAPWVACAAEGGQCNFSGTQTVRYGANGVFATRTATGSIACNNQTFGDPLPGVDKTCSDQVIAIAPTVSPSLPPTPTPTLIPTPVSGAGWTTCAAEGGTCNFSGTQSVRYGANGTYAIRTATTTISCSNQIFGDPLPGVDKNCEVAGQISSTTSQPPAPAPSGTSVSTDAIFSPSSFWYTPIPVSVPLHANSANYVSEFLRQKAAYYNNVTINTWTYSSPVYNATAATPTTKVNFWDCQNHGYTDPGLAAQWSAVPIPSIAEQAAGTDGEMTIYQPSTNTVWEFWQASKVNGQWQACWGGQQKNTDTSDGRFVFPYGTTATGLPFIGGQITAEELKRGEIRHVLGISLVDLADSGIFSWPAGRSDGYNPSGAANRIPEGARFRLDPTINIDALPIHPIAKIIAKAAQKYGFVVWDKAGAISLRAENSKSYLNLGQVDPYNALFNGTGETAILDNFPWDKLQFMPVDYGKS